MDAVNTSASAARAGLIAGLVAYSVWGVMPIYWRLLAAAAPGEILAHRIVWSLFFVMLVIAARGGLKDLGETLKGLVSDRRSGLVILLAALFASINWLINIVGVNTGRVVELGIGMFLTPLATVALGMAFFSERLSKTRLLSVLLAAAGVIIMIWNLGRIPWIAIGVSSTWAIYGALKKLVRIDAWSSIATEHLLMSPFALGFLFWLAAEGAGQFMAGPAKPLDLFLVGTGIMTSIPMIAFSFAAQRLPLIILGFVQYLNPVLTLLLGVFYFGEPIAKAELVPLAFIWSGILLYLLPSLFGKKDAA